jgi:aerobic C4-dicarboxylate transport protein
MRSSQIAGLSDRQAGAAVHRSPLRKLYVQVLIAIAVGILLGHFYPSLAVELKPLSDGFITLIRAVVPVIVFATVAVGIAKMGDMRRVGLVGLRALIYFEVVSTFALVVGLFVGNLLQPGAGLHIDPATLDEKAVTGYVTGAKSRPRGSAAGAGHGSAVRLCPMPHGREGSAPRWCDR